MILRIFSRVSSEFTSRDVKSFSRKKNFFLFLEVFYSKGNEILDCHLFTERNREDKKFNLIENNNKE